MIAEGVEVSLRPAKERVVRSSYLILEATEPYKVAVKAPYDRQSHVRVRMEPDVRTHTEPYSANAKCHVLRHCTHRAFQRAGRRIYCKDIATAVQGLDKGRAQADIQGTLPRHMVSNKQRRQATKRRLPTVREGEGDLVNCEAPPRIERNRRDHR